MCGPTTCTKLAVKLPYTASRNLHQYFFYSVGDKSPKHETKLSILEQIGKGLRYLHHHDKPIVHRNLHPSSILIFEKRDGNNITVSAKLSNFYFKGIESKDLNDPYCMPPELSGVKDYREKCKDKTAVDIFAYGCLIHTVIARKCQSNYHPFYNLNKEAMPVDIIERKNCRKNLWYDDNELASLKKAKEIHFFILADLAINDATDKIPENRPNISTLLKHPMFWTTRDKELFFKGITNDYIKDQDKTADFLKEFQLSFNNKDWGKENYGNLCSDLDGKDYISLVRFIRNKCVHFTEEKARFKSCNDKEKILGDNRAEFIEKMCYDFPDLLYKLFECYRRHVILNVRFFKALLPESYHSYFEKLSDSILTQEKNDFFRILDSGGIQIFFHLKGIKCVVSHSTVRNYIYQNTW